MRTRQAKKEYERGEPIRIIGGNNKGHLGWMNKSRQHPEPNKSYIIIDDQGDVHYTWALNKNMGPIRKITGTYWEAVLAGYPEVELGLNDVAWKIAECQVTDPTPATQYLGDKILESVAVLDKLGAKAKVRRIAWKPSEAGRKRDAGREPVYQRPSDMEDEEGMERI